MSKASYIFPVGSSQQRNFHDAGNVNWVKFYALLELHLYNSRKTYNLRDNCDTIIYLYDDYGNEIDSNDDGKIRICIKDRVYTHTIRLLLC